MAPAHDRSVIRGRLRISKEDRQGNRTENTSPERRRSISDSGGSTRRRMRLLIPLLLSLALPVMAAPKYKIQVSNQLGGWQQYQTVHHRPSASRTAQHRPKQLNQASNTGSLMRMETPWTSSIPGQGSWVGSSALLIPSLLNTSCTEAVSMWKGS